MENNEVPESQADAARTLSKTVVISDCAPMDLAFINELNRYLPDMTVVRTVSGPPKAPPPDKPPAPPRRESKLIRLERFLSRRALTDEEASVLERLPNQTITENDLNAEKGHALIRELKPDILVTRRTCILKDSLFEMAPLPINIHLGLSPDYRGNHTLFWAAFHGRLDALAVTVHRLAPGIDDGEIYGITRPKMRPWNTEALLSVRMLRQCVEVIDRLVNEANRRDGEVPAGKPQLEKGQLCLDRHRTSASNREFVFYRRWRYAARRIGEASTEVYFDETSEQS